MPSQEAQSQLKRPSLSARHSSGQSSQVSQSPSDGAPSSQRDRNHYRPQRHIVGHGRMGPRNTSYGKNLNKLPRQPHGGDGATKTHRRSHSGTSTPAGSPKQSHMKRNASAAVIRNTSHTSLKKNHSSGQLSKHGSSKNFLKSAKHEAPGLRRSLSQPSHQRDDSPSPPPVANPPTVRFDIGDEDEDQENEWTEESASQSPNTTRSNTRQNSVIIDPNRDPPSAEETEESREEADDTASDKTDSTKVSNRQQSNGNYTAPQQPRSTSFYPHRPPDPEIITSKLLQRHPPHQAPPQVTAVTAQTRYSNSPSVNHSAGSTLNETPGRELVSRFLNSGSASGTPRERNFLPQHANTDDDAGGELDPRKRVKSQPNLSRNIDSSSQPASGASTPSKPSTPTSHHTRAVSSINSNHALQPSRTQQKLWLQRASSNIDPAKLIPATIPRTGHGPPLAGAGVLYPPSGENGRIDPRLQRQFELADLEYKVVRRYRNPLTEATSRIAERRPDLDLGKHSSPRKKPPPSQSQPGRSVIRTSTAPASRGQGKGDGIEVSKRGDTEAKRPKVTFQVGGEVDGGSQPPPPTEGERKAKNKTREIEEALRKMWERNWDELSGHE